MKFCSTLLLSLFLTSLTAQTIPANRTVDWTIAGPEDACFAEWPQINFLSEGGAADGTTPNDALLGDLIDGLTEPTIIYFPAGDYLFQQQIQMVSGLVLKGESADNTRLLFDLSDEKDLIAAKGNEGAVIVDVIGSLSKGSQVVMLTDASDFAIGDFVIVNDDDEDLVNNTWAIGTTGQIVQIIGKSGNNLLLNEPLRRSFPTARSPYVREMNMLTEVGLEGLRIDNMSPMTSQRSNIFYRYVWNGFVRCVKSYKTNYAHVELEHAAHCEVSGSYFQDAWAYDDGGKGYGVLVHYASGANLVNDNIFKHLRHSMLVQAGANGNVFGYNYSEDPFWTGTILPADAAGDLVLHGNYPYANLFEGNIVQNIIIDDSHGLNGPYNTFFRNRADNYGIVMSNATVGDSLHFVGNEVTNTGFLKGLYSIYGVGHIEYGNNIKGDIIPAGTSPLPEQTLYLSDIPAYYSTASNWPPIGIPNTISSWGIEAFDRFTSGALTACFDCGPACSAPGGISSGPVNTTKAKLDWTAVPGATKYEVQYKASGPGPWNKIRPLVNTILLTGLTPGTNYVYQIRTRCADGWTSFSPTATFSTIPLRAGSTENLQLYPNPVTDQLYLHTPASAGSIIISLFDEQGRLVYHEMVEHAGGDWYHTIQPDITPGLYQIQLQLPGQVVHEQFMKQ